MELLEKLDIRVSQNGNYKRRWGLFLCPYCFARVERAIEEGRKRKSCGCMHFELIAQKIRTHNSTNTKLYGVWKSMKARCYWPKHDNYQYYGGKGIVVCNEWNNDFTAFKIWAESNGYKEGYTIDRVESDKNYCPENCQWLSRSDHTVKDKTGKAGHRWTSEQRQRMSEQRMGHKLPNRKKSGPQKPEHTEKIRIAMKKYWEAKRTNK